MLLNKIKSLFLVALIAISFSCEEDFLETSPTDSISSADALSSPANINLVLNGLHRLMYAQYQIIPGGTSTRAGEHYWIPVFDAMTGALIHSSRGNGWQRSDLQWVAHRQATYTTPYQLWFQRYHLIAETSAIINKVEADGLTVDADMKNILGQSHAYRAWAYYRLVSTYAKGYIIGDPQTDPGVPLLTGTSAPYESGPRATVAEIYAQIEADIDGAIAYLSDGASPAADKSHISLNAAYGIKARVALSKGDWATAASAAAQARDGYGLMGENLWLSGFNTVSLPEVIWGSTVIDTETVYYRSYFYLMCPTFNGSQNRGNPKLFNKERYAQIPTTDFRRKAVLPLAPNTNSAASNGEGGSFATDPNYNNATDFWAAWGDVISTYGMTTRHNTHPFMHVKFLQENPGTIDPDDVIMMRSSEMYLIEAEAKVMQGDITGAQTILQTFGSSRDTAYDSSVYTTQADLMSHIKFQRYVELYGEGFSWHDHIRWDDAIDLTNSGASAVLYQDGFMQDKPSTNPDWIWKIPQAEIDANPYITEADQN
jgi:hypothetical protein